MSTTHVTTAGQCHQSDVILLCGPPHVGKTRYYREKLADSYTRVSAKELFATDKELSIRQVVNQHVVASLRKGCRVVIDDENETRKKRESFVRVIKQKCPKVKLECVRFIPFRGVTQLWWAQEFYKAWCVESDIVDIHTANVTEMICRWERQFEPPSEAEGYRVTNTKTYLRRNSNPKSEVPALFVQWEAVVSLTGHASDVRVTEGIHEAFSLWSSCNPCGRIIIICDGIATRGGGADGQLREMLAGVMGHLSNCPVYMIVSEDVTGVGTFSLPPQPGILAFLVQLHHVDIGSCATKYLYKTTSHMTMAANAGVRYIKASRVFQYPHLVKTDHSTTMPPVPGVLRDIERDGETSAAVTPTVPLYEAGIKASDGICQMKLAYGRSLYLGVKDKAILRRYNDLYQDAASRHSAPTSPSTARNTHNAPASASNDVSPAARHRSLPRWMLTESNKKSSEKKVALPQDGVVTATSRTVYVMNEEELLNVARDLVHQMASRNGETPETPGVQTSNTHPTNIADHKTISQECQRSMGGAQVTAAGSIIPATQPTLDSETDHQNDTTLMIVDDFFEPGQCRPKKPPARLRRHLDASDTGQNDAVTSDTVQDTRQIPFGATGHTTQAHCVTMSCDVTSPMSQTVLPTLSDTVILPPAEVHMTSLRQLPATCEPGKDLSVGMGNIRECGGVRGGDVTDTVGVSPNSDVKLADRAKRRRLSKDSALDLSILDDLI